MARKFCYICAGMLMLALSYHFGASTAVAQAPSNGLVEVTYIGGIGSSPYLAATVNGDVYTAANSSGPWLHVGNVFSGGPTPALHQSWGQVKARYQNTPGVTVTPGADNR
jgi:hypothetical protein